MIVHRLKKAHRALSAIIPACWIFHLFSLMVATNFSPGATPSMAHRLASSSLLIFLVCRLIVHLRPNYSHPTTSKTNSNHSLDHHHWAHEQTPPQIRLSVSDLQRNPASRPPLRGRPTMHARHVLLVLFLFVVLGLDPTMTTTTDARELGLRAWTVASPTGREDLADMWPPEMTRNMALIYERMIEGGGGINPDTAVQWMLTWWFEVLLGLAWLGLGWYVLGLAGKALWRVLVGAPSIGRVAPRQSVVGDEEKGISGVVDEVENVEGGGRQGGKRETETLRFQGEARVE
ncbi:uncharacterized protein BO72DRAFT_499074 [Aspergillus fijiensis CBS 313.89]|uniref:Uncharacterized protein n=1 Tax=Aspergillus fijiensis CBS 313.89 TaxID=1448319 RepID=A0A8G1RLQ6_9EURO|nr:uncharacterized protein BO72DRAFT_499074 [Aspergillus fijiensis CBS 313.89]RAK74453.1 hypothetical protein BO72DRAFT_499074 [Aspergillus fijiensis CBS 313.89]